MKKLILIVSLILFFQNCFSQTFQDFYPSSNASGSYFGGKVDVFNNEVLVSSSAEYSNFSGKVYLFNLTGLGLQQTDTFYPSDALVDDSFGSSISIQNDFIAIGSPYHDANLENSGAVYLYKKTNGVYLLLQKITAPNFSLNANFGFFVKFYNDQLFISASGVEPGGADVNANNGAVYVYSYDGANWVFSQELTVANSKNFGKKIEVENTKLVISSNGGYDTTTNFSLHTYNWNNSNWIFANSIELGNLELNISDFSLSNNQVFLTTSALNFAQSLLILSENNGAWDLANSSSINIYFNNQVFTSVKVIGNNMFIGSSAYILQMPRKFPILFYKKINNIWTFQTVFYGSGPDGFDDFFGMSLASDGNTLVVGAPYEGFTIGKAYYIDVATLGNSVFEKKSFSVYPNPTNNHKINIESETTLDEIQVVNTNGQLMQLIKNPVLNNHIYTLENLPKGVYLLKLVSGNQSVIKKIIVD
jgi:hypothetical protein